MFDTRGKNDTRTHLWMRTMMFPKGKRRIAMLDVSEGCFRHWNAEKRFGASCPDEILLVNDDSNECRRMRLEVAQSGVKNVHVRCGDIHSILPHEPRFAVVWLDYCHSPANIFDHQVKRAARAIIAGGFLAITASQRVKKAKRQLKKLLQPHVLHVDGFYSYGEMGPMGFLEGKIDLTRNDQTPVIVIDDSDESDESDETDETDEADEADETDETDDSSIRYAKSDNDESEDEQYVPRPKKRMCLSVNATGWVCLPCQRMHPISIIQCTTRSCRGTRDADGVPFDVSSERQTRSAA